MEHVLPQHSDGEKEKGVVQFSGIKGLLNKISRGKVKGGDETGDRAGDTIAAVMTPDMIRPLDKPVSTNRATQIYKKYMLEVGYLEKDDIADYVRSLKEDMLEWEEELKYEITSTKEQVAEAKAEVKRLHKQLRKCKDDDDREYVQEELDTAEAECNEETGTHEKFVAELARFKKDKREFLLNYINSEIHGEDWQKKDISK